MHRAATGPGLDFLLARARIPDGGRAGARRRLHALGRGGFGLVLALASALCLLLAGSALQAWDVSRLMQAANRYGPQGVAAASALQTLVATAAAQEESRRLLTVNDFFNQRVVFTEDIVAWGQPDYWATPLELLVRARGDCEDYAIAKYFALSVAGVPTSRLRLVYVRATLGATSSPGSGIVQAHMVLAYYPSPDAEPLILDNLVSEVMPAGKRPDLAPVFSFNTEGLWQGAQGASAGDPVSRLSRWREVLSRAKGEGF